MVAIQNARPKSVEMESSNLLEKNVMIAINRTLTVALQVVDLKYAEME